MDDASSGKNKRKFEDRSSKNTKKIWTPKEDAVLIASLNELCNRGWKRENGIFRNGYTAALERELKSKLPGSNIKACPHIESRLKLLKRQYDAITEMQCRAGLQWDDEANMLICEEDDVWEEWVQTHSDAKGLRNKQFPYYNDLHVLFGNRGSKKGTNNDDKVLVDDDNNAVTNLTVDDSFEEDEKGTYVLFHNGSLDKEVDPRVNNNGVTIGGADSFIENYKKRKVDIDVTMNASNRNILDEPEGASDQSEDATGKNKSDDVNISPIEVSNKKSRISDSGSSELGQLAKIFGAFLEKYQEHLSLLTQIVGQEAASEKIVGEKRAKLNGELTKLPNLNLQARLRAASLIVSDPAKLDLFYSLPKEERREWVSMLLTGLI